MKLEELYEYNKYDGSFQATGDSQQSLLVSDQFWKVWLEEIPKAVHKSGTGNYGCSSFYFYDFRRSMIHTRLILFSLFRKERIDKRAQPKKNTLDNTWPPVMFQVFFLMAEVNLSVYSIS